jgi:hypothetical protein
LLPLLNDPCLIRPVLGTSQISVSPGAQLSLADTGFGSRLPAETQALNTSAAIVMEPVLRNDMVVCLNLPSDKYFS